MNPPDKVRMKQDWVNSINKQGIVVGLPRYTAILVASFARQRQSNIDSPQEVVGMVENAVMEGGKQTLFSLSGAVSPYRKRIHYGLLSYVVLDVATPLFIDGELNQRLGRPICWKLIISRIIQMLPVSLWTMDLAACRGELKQLAATSLIS